LAPPTAYSVILTHAATQHEVDEDHCTTTVVVDNRNLPSNDSDVEDSPSKPKGFHGLFRSLAKQKSKWERRTDNNTHEIVSERRGQSTVLIVFLLSM
jgi:hypothetical protein